MRLSGKKRPPLLAPPKRLVLSWLLEGHRHRAAKPPGAAVLNLAWEGAALIMCLFLFPARLNPKPAISFQGPQLAWEKTPFERKNPCRSLCKTIPFFFLKKL